MSDFISFPEEIVSEILKRLSIEDAVRCLTVSKSWYSLITSPSFISLHSKQIASSTNKKDLILVRDYHSEQPNKELYSLHLDDDESFGESKRHFHFPIRSLLKDTFFRVIGCINGVVCLSDDIQTYTEEIVLWNPSISKLVTLPEPLFGFCTHGGFMHSIGFGFDATTNDFKVVRVVYLMDTRSMIPPKVEIYEPRVGSWREVDSKGFSHIIDEKSPQAFLHGNVHWVMGCRFPYTKLIVSFDLRTEEFGVMNLPDILNEHNLKQDFCVSVLGESLSLIHDTCSKNGNSCCIWVMKQYGVPHSWTKLFRVDATMGFFQVFGFRRNGEALVKAAPMYHGNLKQFVSLETKSRQLKILAGFGNWKAFYVDNYVETLALLGMKGHFVLDNESVDTKSPDKESCDPEDESRTCLEPAHLSRPDNVPPVQLKISWFGPEVPTQGQTL